MKSLYEILSTPGITIAVVGATDYAYKYGSVIYRQLKATGWRVFPVNPNRPTVDGDKCYANLSELPEKPLLVNFVTPPEVTLDVLKECKKLGWLNAWVQPGAEDRKVVAYLEENGFNYLINACIMVHSVYTQRNQQ